jgi:hypothetical protein
MLGNDFMDEGDKESCRVFWVLVAFNGAILWWIITMFESLGRDDRWDTKFSPTLISKVSLPSGSGLASFPHFDIFLLCLTIHAYDMPFPGAG